MPGTVEKQESIDIRELHRLRRLGERRVVFPFRWPWFGEVRANQWRVELELRNGSRQAMAVMWKLASRGWRRGSAARITNPTVEPRATT
jgi:hypothetical protein